jgi:hypothetical protein
LFAFKNDSQTDDFKSSSGTRGVRNNNPGNIRISTTLYKGKVQKNTDGAFEQFESIEYGVRALIKLISVYYFKHKKTTIRQIISRFAPQNENNTQSYINNVSKRMNTHPDKTLIWEPFTIRNLVFAIVKSESGDGVINQQIYDSAVKLL